MRSRQTESGQATLEYAALLALVAVVLGGVGTAAAVTGLGGTLLEAFRRALCVVTGQECARGRPYPCVLASDGRREDASVSVLFVRLGAGGGLVRELRSDGSVAVTVVDELHGGAEAGVGASGGLATGERSFALGGALRAAALARAGRGRTWLLPEPREADALIAALGDRPERVVTGLPRRLARRLTGRGGREVPPPDESFGEGGPEAVVDARGGTGVSAFARAVGGLALGRRTERRAGRTTYYLDLARDLRGGAESLLGDGSGSAGGHVTAAVTLDPGGRPVRFSLLGAGAVSGRLALPSALRSLWGEPASAGPRAPGRRYELEATLDLEDRESARAVGALLGSLRRDARGGAAGRAAARALWERLERHGRLDARVYRTASSTTGGGGGVALGPRIGGDLVWGTERSRLTAAFTRAPDGAWERRLDCAV
jgi:Flp pilus assembly pilin Flp